jgi:hypothetical protein
MIIIIFYLLYIFLAFRFKFKNVFTMIYKGNQLFYSNKELLDFNNFIDKHIYLRDYKKEHIKIVTNNNNKISKIIDYLKLNLNSLNIIERPITHKFIGNEKGYIKNNKFFWSIGNNFYIYNVIYEFRKNVIPYKKINNFINLNQVMIYSKEYYESLEKYNDFEIELFLFFNPFFIDNNLIKHGYHRLFAMIGRIVKDKNYIPVYVIKK